MKNDSEEWEKMVTLLAEFKKEFGHCHLPANWHHRELLDWLHIHRDNPVQLSAEQACMLFRMGVDFGSLENRWLQRFSELCEFKEKYGHCVVRESYADNPPLAIWVSKLRQRKHIQSPTRIRWLNAIGFDWDPRASQWMQKQLVCDLVDFKKRFGHFNVPTKWPENKKLASWVRWCRYAINPVSPEIREEL